ncbi:hypothetical protein [Thermoanaerobacterium sp. R66]|uniref:hypothetical protein n=1 Tax=Thermoanaerobacterium sp. R66 TaxID=2742479 RepID=UPI00238030B7|nr:hypothetical protein [Thermoanaerobacterium sp. R66]MDE4542285.1 hypothetical protein [Thermoanaerobacterium sp. R66]
MKIRVSYAELKSGPGYNNKKAEAEIEVDVAGDIDKAFTRAWDKVKAEVRKQLDDEEIPF